MLLPAPQPGTALHPLPGEPEKQGDCCYSGDSPAGFLGIKPCKVCWKSLLHPVQLRDCPCQGVQGPHSLWGCPQPCHSLSAESPQIQAHDACGIMLTLCPLVSHSWDCSEPSAPHSPWDGPRICPQAGIHPILSRDGIPTGAVGSRITPQQGLGTGQGGPRPWPEWAVGSGSRAALEIPLKRIGGIRAGGRRILLKEAGRRSRGCIYQGGREPRAKEVSKLSEELGSPTGWGGMGRRITRGHGWCQKGTGL